MGEYDTLLEKDNLVILQQITATENAVLPLEELDYLSPDMNPSEIEAILDELESEGYVEVLSVETPERVPSEYYAVTPAAREAFKEVRLWSGIGVLYQAYNAVEVSDRIKDIREHYPNGLL